MNIKLIVLFSICVGFTLGCEKQGHLSPHESAPATKPSAATKPDSSDQLATTTDLSCGAALQLSQELLRPEVLENPQEVVSNKRRQQLITLDNFLLSKTADDCTETKQIQLTYLSALLKGCSESLQNCRNETFFRLDANKSSAIAENLADTASHSISNRYNLLKMSLELRSELPRPQTERKFFNLLRPYFEDLEKNKKTEQLATEQRYVARLLALSPEVKKDKNLLNSLNPLAFRRDRPSWLGEAAAAAFQLALATKNIDKENVAQDDSLKSFFELDSAYRKKHPKVVKVYNIQPLPKDSLLLLLVDRVYKGTLHPDDGRSFFDANTSPEVRNEYLRIVKDYLREQMLFLTSESNGRMGEIFSSPDIASSEIRRRSQSEGEIMATRWRQFVEGVSRVRGLVVQGFKDAGADTSTVRELDDQIQGIRSDIKYMVVYPQMMMMSYYMSVRKYEEAIRVFFYTFNITSDLIIKLLMEGSLRPWFDYALENEDPIYQHEFVRVIKNALETDAFDDFKVAPADFFKEINRRWLDVKVDRFEEATKLLQKSYSPSSNYTDFLDLCQSAKTGKSPRYMHTLADLKRAPVLGKIMDISQEVVGSLSGTYSGDRFTSLPGYFLYSASLVNLMEHIRIEVNPTIFFLDQIQNAINDYSKAVNMDENVINQTNEALQKNLVQMKRLKESYVSQFLNVRKTFDNCFLDLLDREREGQMRVTQAEEAYFHQVHKDILKVRQNPALKSEINKKYNYSVGGYNSSIEITENGFKFSKIDFLLRVRRWLLEGLKTEDGVNIPPVAPYLKINVPENLNESLMYLENPVFIAFLENADEFALQMSNMITVSGLGASNPLDLQWFSNMSISWSARRDWVSALAILYRLNSPEQKPYIELKELTELTLRLLSSITLSPEEQKFYAERKLPGRYWYFEWTKEVMGLNDLIFYSKSRNLRGMLDPVLEYLGADMMGSYGDESRWQGGEGGMPPQKPSELVPNRVAAKKYFLQRQAETLSLFGSEGQKQIDNRFDNYFKQLILDDETKAQKFIEYAVEFKKENKGNYPEKLYIDYDYGQPFEFITKTQREAYSGKNETFHKETGFMFQTKSEDQK